MIENVIQIKSRTTINAGASAKTQGNIMCAKNIYIRNPRTCTCENVRYLESIIDDSVVTCDEIIDALRSELINFNDQKATCKMKNFYILLTVLLIIILLLITVAIYYYDYHIQH